MKMCLILSHQCAVFVVYFYKKKLTFFKSSIFKMFMENLYVQWNQAMKSAE